MRAQGIYGYSVLQYEKQGDGFRDPRGYDPQILACFGTHDTPTLEGYRTGRDIEWWQELGWISEDEAVAGREARAHDVAGIAALMPKAENLSAAAHGALAAGPAALISVQLDDILGQVEAQNLPGTIDQHPNWRRSYGITPEQLAAHDGLNDMAEWMRSAGRAPLALGEKESNYEH
jgi:4-alpha-glucanotransferase